MLPTLKMARLGLAASLCLLIWAPVATPAAAPGLLCALKPGQAALAPETLRGLAQPHPRPGPTRIPDLCERAGSQAGARGRHVQRAPRRARADTGRSDRPLALSPRLCARRQAGAHSSRRRNLPRGIDEDTGERDAARLVHRRSAQRLRRAFSRAGALPELCRDGLLTPKACRAGARKPLINGM